MNKRQRKKKILSGLNKEERYRRTHCPVCALNIVVMNITEFQDYKNKRLGLK